MRLSELRQSFVRSLRARNLSRTTVEWSGFALVALGSAVGDIEVADVERPHIEEALAGMYDRNLSDSTVNGYFRVWRSFFAWCIEEEELSVSPMDTMRPPVVTEKETQVLTLAQVRQLLLVCGGNGFYQRRNLAIVRLLASTGMRRAECAALTVEDVDLDAQLVRVYGKGRKYRTLPFADQTATALDRYVRARSRHHYATKTARLWLGQHGPLTGNGIRQVLRKVGRHAGVPDLHPHQLRHTFAHTWLSKGSNETDLMQLAGWRSRQMLQRYAASAASQRAQEAYRRMTFDV